MLQTWSLHSRGSSDTLLHNDPTGDNDKDWDPTTGTMTVHSSFLLGHVHWNFFLSFTHPSLCILCTYESNVFISTNCNITVLIGDYPYRGGGAVSICFNISRWLREFLCHPSLTHVTQVLITTSSYLCYVHGVKVNFPSSDFKVFLKNCVMPTYLPHIGMFPRYRDFTAFNSLWGDSVANSEQDAPDFPSTLHAFCNF